MKILSLALTILWLCVSSSFAAEYVNLNTATQEQLESLNGVGPKKALAIIEYRNKNGKFKTVDELDNVPGFGAKIVAKLRPAITVGSDSVARQASPTAENLVQKPAIPEIVWEPAE